MQALENLSEPQVIIFIVYLDSEEDWFIALVFFTWKQYSLSCFSIFWKISIKIKVSWKTSVARYSVVFYKMAIIISSLTQVA